MRSRPSKPSSARFARRSMNKRPSLRLHDMLEPESKPEKVIEEEHTMSWIEKLLPPRIQRNDGAQRRIPEGLWVKCPSCETVLYKADLEKNLEVCPKCDHHMRMSARERIDALLDPEGRYEIARDTLALDTLKFKDSKKYPERLKEALEAT